ncbi:Dbl homology domain-containing protein [Gigaspora rosea]|uniref:Dbl homology domain-containing protein n=1 Tax=Gigaspora rosea TaxID=44941 RepID=A0A397U4M4_9GLOM|nr:Dbl homology domain-containing protein [Gigaspora rosea]
MSVDDVSVVRDTPTLTSPSDIFALQADAEKETDVATRSSQMRKFIACEIYSTEQSYLEHLKKLKKIFMDPFIDAAQQSNPLVNPDDIKIIFAHVDELIELSTIIVEDLESSMDPWQESESTVGEVFLKYNPYFEALLLYAENHQQSRLAIKRANENVLYRKILQSQNKQDSSRLVLSDYMIMPIQRVTRYCLLLQELKKYTPEFHMDFDDLCHAVDNMKILAIQCDKAINDIELL